MAHIQIERLHDSSECEDCGLSIADGARITIDGGEPLVLDPRAGCFGGDDYQDADIMEALLVHLGHTVEWVL